MDFTLFVLQTPSELALAHSVSDVVISDIADRVQAGTLEPDVDNFENIFVSAANSAALSPNVSPNPARVPLPPSMASDPDQY